MVSDINEFSSQIFVSKYRYSQGNVQVRRGLGNYQDDRYIENIKQAPQRKIRNLLFRPPGLLVVCRFVPRETRLLLFFKHKLEGLDDCLFRAIQTYPPSPVKA